MAQYQDATARQLDLAYEEEVVEQDAQPETGHHRLCEICGRVEAHLTIPAAHGRQPAIVCLRCHHAVRQQRRMLRAALTRSPAPATAPGGLIVQNEGSLPGDRKYRELEHRRHRAQIAARKALKE